MIKIVSTLIIFSWILRPASSIADDSLVTVHYHERVPYLVRTTNGVEGLAGTPATLAFKNANIPFVWKQTPPKRQLKILNDNKGLDCIVGWFKNSKREKLAKFTHAIYQDKQQIALTKVDNMKLRSGVTTGSLLSNREITLLLKDGYSYGTFLDNKISKYKPHIYKSTIANIAILKMITHNRVDYFFISEEEADSLIDSSGISKDKFKYITFTDMPEGEKRYILCSKMVDDQIIQKLNSAILGSNSK